MNPSAGHIPDSLNRIVEAADELFAPYGDEADVYVVESILHREIGRMALQARSGAIRPPRPEEGASPACSADRNDSGLLIEAIAERSALLIAGLGGDAASNIEAAIHNVIAYRAAIAQATCVEPPGVRAIRHALAFPVRFRVLGSRGSSGRFRLGTGSDVAG